MYRGYRACAGRKGILMQTARAGKRWFPLIICMAIVLAAVVTGGLMYAKEKEVDDTISEGVFLGGVDVSGMDREEAEEAVWAYVQQISGSAVTFIVEEHEIEVPVSELGFSYQETNAVDEALSVGKTGNIVKRYKEKKDLEKHGKVIALQYGFDKEAVTKVLQEKCTASDIKAVNGGLEKTSSGFQIKEGTAGHGLNVEKSADIVMQYLNSEWQGGTARITLVTEDIQPKGTKAELEKVKDLIGTATTSYKTSSKSRSGNIQQGAELINGTVLYPGEEFSTYECVSPISIENGYYMAPSYASGKVVETPGGGICQVSTTLYNAVLKAELNVTQRSNHSMIVTYVDPAMDAAIAGTYKDFKFTNNTNVPIYIEAVTSGKQLTFNIYGMETRSASREVKYQSEVVSETEPATVITQTNSNFGTISTTQSAHKGCVARLWKIVYENGVEVSRQEVNKSTYSMAPKYLSVGMANALEAAAAEMAAAIAANDESAVRAVISKYGTVKATVDEAADADTASEADTRQAAAPADSSQHQTEAPPVPAVPTEQPASVPAATEQAQHTEAAQSSQAPQDGGI